MKNPDARNAIDLLKQDHRNVESLFEELEQCEEDSEKVQLAQSICTQLTIHAKVEEELFYPAARSALGQEGDDLINESTVEHRSLKQLIAEIDGASTSDELFDANLTVLKEYVHHHVKEEEEELMPMVSDSGIDLEALGARIATRKESLETSASRAKEPRSSRRRAVHVPKLAGRRSSTGKAPAKTTRTRSASSRTATARKSKAANKKAPAKRASAGRSRR